jgi:tRNA pseudouridine38-40 synthase
MRYAIKFAYDGTEFSGSQRQPEVRTVEGAIIECLTSHHVISDPKASNLQLASRTDAGVSALGNVVALDTEYSEKETLNILNSKLPHCWFYGIAKVDSDFRARKAKMRWYRYHLNTGGTAENQVDYELFKSILSSFEGAHDFKNFANPSVEDTTRTIHSITTTEKPGWLLIDFSARSFLWHLIRRLINSWVQLANGKVTKEVLLEALNDPSLVHDFGLAPAKPLILMDVEYDFKFEIDKHVLEKTIRRIHLNLEEVAIKNEFFNCLLKKMI